MRTFKTHDFKKHSGANYYYACASDLGFPPGGIVKQFAVEGRGVFEFVKTLSLRSSFDFHHDEDEITHFVYKNATGVVIEVFND